MLRIFFVTVFSLTMFMGQTHQALAATDPVFKGLFSNLAVSGYDTVAYFTEGKPVEGTDTYKVNWKGSVWRFSNAENKAAFEAGPEKYAPQYGGYCAYAMSKGATASAVPDAWTIVDGKLYLNYSQGVRDIWNSDQTSNIRRADRNWPGFLN